MDKDYLVKLTLAVYRVTKVFPEKEPLKFLIREKACQILSSAILFQASNPVSLEERQREEIKRQLLNSLEAIDSFFKVAMSQDWLKQQNFFVLRKEYNSLRDSIFQQKGIEKEEREVSPQDFGKVNPKTTVSNKLDKNALLINDRQKRILDILKKKDKAQVWEFKKTFPNVSKRTLRRDFEHLLAMGLVKREGEGNNTYYKCVRT
ncbi:DeoR family transcriptional regulator [bacterium]|nr:DeoR family transcriptional regulator [bacterium]